MSVAEAPVEDTGQALTEAPLERCLEDLDANAGDRGDIEAN